MAWDKKHIISIKDFSIDDIEFFLEKSEIMEKKLASGKAGSLMDGKILANMFFEPSTRTRMSFETAMKRLGGQTIGFDSNTMSSEVKGETIADTVRVISDYVDAIVIRHPVEGSARLASEYSDVPVINGGDGANQHPTQTLLDLYTIKKEFGSIEDISIAVVGDLKYGRTVHSLMEALRNYDINLRCISPKELRMPRGIINDLKNKNITVNETEKLKVRDIDVIYVTRIQKERFPDLQEYMRVKDAFVLDMKTVEKLKDNAIILHPLPRVGEIDPAIDKTKYARYFQQTKNSIPVRMALLCMVCGVKF